ncbi:unnamed protein product [Pedinophyceae sp. YPF-701]|nr:unnamed protein product [Pedinophyceae sp. YPF-701]
MNIFRLAGDLSHVFAVIVLLLKIYATKSCAGVSLKTQAMYVAVFCTRYLDLFTHFVSLYNSVMKVVFLGCSGATVYLMTKHKKISRTYDKDHDSFKVEFLAGPAALLALLFHTDWSFVEILWSFSIWLEALAILPQLVLLQRTKNIDNLTGNYIFLLGSYRALYLLNWIYRFATERRYWDPISWIAGLIQTGIYSDFFYYYYLSWKENKKLTLPA